MERVAGPSRSAEDVLRAAPVLALALLGVSFAAVLVRLADAPATIVAFWRLVLTVGLVLPIVVASGQAADVRRLSAREWAWIGAAGSFLGLHFVSWFQSLAYVSVASSTVLVTSHPIFVALLSARWLGERPARREWAGIAAAVAGAALIGWGDLGGGPDPLAGDALAVLSALFLALYLLIGRHVRARLGLWGYVTPVYAVAALVCGLLAAVRGLPFLGYPRGTWLAFAGLAAGPMLLGHTGFNWALRHVRAYIVSLVQLLEPVGATALAILILGKAERPGWNTVLGGITILAGVWVSVRVRLSGRGEVGGSEEARG